MGDDAPDRAPLRSLSRRILLAVFLILAGIAAAALAGKADLRTFLGGAAGAGIAYGNFFLIRKILEKAFAGGGAVHKGFVVQYVLKFLGLIGVIYLVVRYSGLDTAGFLLGLSALFLGILLEAVARSFGAKS